MSKIELFGNLFRIFFSNCSARVSIVIDHPCEFCQHHLLSAAAYCPLSLYAKIEAKWKHFLKIFCCREAHGEYLPYILSCKSPNKVTSAIFFAADATMLDRIKIAPRQFRRRAWKRKMSLGHRPNSPHTIYHCQAGNSSPFCSLLFLSAPFYSLRLPFSPFYSLRPKISWMAENDTIKPIAALPLQAAGTGSIMEPQTRPVEKYWLHGGATNETSLIFWLHGEARNGARNEATNGARDACKTQSQSYPDDCRPILVR